MPRSSGVIRFESGSCRLVRSCGRFQSSSSGLIHAAIAAPVLQSPLRCVLLARPSDTKSTAAAPVDSSGGQMSCSGLHCRLVRSCRCVPAAIAGAAVHVAVCSTGSSVEHEVHSSCYRGIVHGWPDDARHRSLSEPWSVSTRSSWTRRLMMPKRSSS
jgi:hypothetical protein